MLGCLERETESATHLGCGIVMMRQLTVQTGGTWVFVIEIGAVVQKKEIWIVVIYLAI